MRNDTQQLEKPSASEGPPPVGARSASEGPAHAAAPSQSRWVPAEPDRTAPTLAAVAQAPRATTPNPRLPREVPVASNPRRVITTIAGTLALLLAINAACGWLLDRDPHNLGYWVVQYKWKLLHDLDRPVDWLVLGDSSGNQGVDPAVLEQSLGGSALNLCTIGDLGLLNDAWLLADYIDRWGPPRAAIVVHAYDIWHRPVPLPLVARVPPRVLDRDGVQPQCVEGLRSRLHLLEYRYVPLDAQHLSLARLFRGETTIVLQGGLNWQKGFMRTVAARPAEVARDLDEHLQFLRDPPAVLLSSDNRAGLDALMRLAEQHDFPLFIAAGPIYDGLASEPSFRRYHAALTAAIAEHTQSSRHVRVLFTDPLTFPADQLQIVDHVTGPAAVSYTQALAERLRRSGLLDESAQPADGTVPPPTDGAVRQP